MAGPVTAELRASPKRSKFHISVPLQWQILQASFCGASIVLGISLRFRNYSSLDAMSQVSSSSSSNSSNDAISWVPSIGRLESVDETVWLAMESDQRWLKASTGALPQDGLSWVEATWAPTHKTLLSVRQSLQQHGYAVIDEECEGFEHIDIIGVMDFWARGAQVPNALREDARKLWSVLKKVEPALLDRRNIFRLDAEQQFHEGNPRSLHLDGVTNMLNLWCPQHPARNLPQALLFFAGAEQTRRIHSDYIRENRELLDKLSHQGDLSTLVKVLGHWGEPVHKVPQIPTTVLRGGHLALPGRAVIFRSAGLVDNATYHAGYELPGSPGGASILKFLLGKEPGSIEEAWRTMGILPE
jgi:hypothetical protein